MSSQTFALLLRMCSGVLAGDWSVALSSAPTCAAVGSTVVLPCSYDFPQSFSNKSRKGQPSGQSGVEEEYKVLSEMWCLGEGRCITPSYVYHSDSIFPDPAYQDRVEYLGERGNKNCSLRISKLRQNDSGNYVFYLITSHPTQKMPEQSGIQLLVADSLTAVTALVSPSGNVTEGSPLSLFCCSQETNPEHRYRWYKDSSPAPGHDGQVWSMTNISTDEAGSYYCQVQTGDGAQSSPKISIDVQYPPRQTSVTLFPGGELQGEGSAVTLTCSSDANPPVNTYTWYQGPGCFGSQQTKPLASPKGTGHTFHIANTTMEEMEHFCCVASNRHGSQKYTLTVRAQRDSKGWRLVIVTATIVALLVLIGIMAFIARRRRAVSSQSYILTATTTTVP
ncbi:B-cell receptor CD22 [Lampris incognitus]|uniref:B-cell receptor CD22 n=1 Tax=Lampris incognitus TaxID=2546036 RepID=UPI0024B52BF2|nr:B-cell receptor CD22 [Lampris incognitus]